jgi:plastocyanin
MLRHVIVTGAAAAALAVAASAPAAAKPAVLNGKVGPGFTITLTKAGKKVRSLKAGTYKIVVSDRSPDHNFVLEKARGGTFERQITSVPFTGAKSFTVKLTAGKWEFYCTPHESMMRGEFTVR